MSNIDYTDRHQQKQNKKVIKIRPIERIKQQFQQDDTSSEDQLLTVEQKVTSLKKELQQLEKKRTTLLESTTEAIEQEKEQWQQEKDTLIEEAKQLGYNEGFSKGKNESLQQYSELINEANEIVKTARKDYYATVDQSKDTVIQLAIHTAEKILSQHIQEQPESFLPIVEAAIKTIKNAKQITIYVHPNQYSFLLKQKEELMNSVDGHAQLEIYIDHDLHENDCLIEHPFGQVDASIDTQLEQIRTVLQNVSNGE